jgi:hypothetical protein
MPSTPKDSLHGSALHGFAVVSIFPSCCNFSYREKELGKAIISLVPLMIVLFPLAEFSEAECSLQEQGSFPPFCFFSLKGSSVLMENSVSGSCLLELN